MAIYTPIKLYQGQPGTSGATIYTVPAGKSVIIKQVLIVNTTGSNATATLNSVPSSGTASASNRIISSLDIAANSVLTLDLSQVMTSGDFLSALQGTASALTLTISGVEIA